MDGFVLDQIQPGLEGLQAFLTLEQWYSLLFLGIFVRLEVLFQDRGLGEYLWTHWARYVCSRMDPLNVCFQVIQQTKCFPAIFTGVCLSRSVSLFMAFQELHSPKAHFAYVALVTLVRYIVELLVL